MWSVGRARSWAIRPHGRHNPGVAEGDDSDKVQRQIDDLTERLDANHSNLEGLRDRAAAAETRADSMEARELVDREMIAELQAEGQLSREHAAQMEAALSSSRMIGAAIGIIMASLLVSQSEAFDILKQTSQRTNRKLRDLASEVVETGKMGALE